MSELAALRTAKAALDEGLISDTDFDVVKAGFLKAQQIKAGLDAGFIREDDIKQARETFFQSLDMGMPGQGHSPPATTPVPPPAPRQHLQRRGSNSACVNHPASKPLNPAGSAPAHGRGSPAAGSRSSPSPPPPPINGHPKNAIQRANSLTEGRSIRKSEKVTFEWAVGEFWARTERVCMGMRALRTLCFWKKRGCNCHISVLEGICICSAGVCTHHSCTLKCSVLSISMDSLRSPLV